MPTVPLTCPNCGGQFDYEYVPGVSVSAIRLVGKRYMACPLCGRWGTFDLRGGRAAAAAGFAPAPGPTPTYSDRRLLVRRLPWILVPIAVILLSLLWRKTYPTAVFVLDVAMVVTILISVVVSLRTSVLPRTR